MQTMSEKLIQVLDSIGIPVAEDQYMGTEEHYVVFNYNTEPVDYADDEPQHQRYQVRVHHFTPDGKPMTEVREQMKIALYQAGFTYPSEVVIQNNDEEHKALECEIMEGLNLE